MAMIQFLRNIFQVEITLGDILAVLTPLVLAAIGFFVIRWIKAHPFKMEISDQPFDIDPNEQLHRTFGKRIELRQGKSQLTLAVRTRAATSGSPFDIRFVQHIGYGQGWRDVAPDIINISNVEVPEWNQEAERERDFVGPNIVDKRSNGVGGFVVATRKPKRWVVGQYLWIELEVAAHKPWSGYVSYEGRTDRRAFVRRRVKVR